MGAAHERGTQYCNYRQGYFSDSNAFMQAGLGFVPVVLTGTHPFPVSARFAVDPHERLLPCALDAALPSSRLPQRHQCAANAAKIRQDTGMNTDIKEFQKSCGR